MLHLFGTPSTLSSVFIGKINHFLRVFTRYDKMVSRYLNFISFAAALVWLR